VKPTISVTVFERGTKTEACKKGPRIDCSFAIRPNDVLTDLLAVLIDIQREPTARAGFADGVDTDNMFRQLPSIVSR
jgi:hypothetical protein